MKCSLAECKNAAHPDLVLVSISTEGEETKLPICRACMEMIKARTVVARGSFSMSAKS